jgi:hypothetical protein
MGLLNTLERLLVPGKRPEKQIVNLKEIVCKPRKKDWIQTFNTSAMGCEHSNPDGSKRQEALAKLKVGEKVRLLWDGGETGSKKMIYLVRGPKTQELSISNCFGRLSDKVAGDVIRWLTRDNITTTAKVIKIVGGTAKRPKLGCVIELSTYRVSGKNPNAA